MINLTTCLKNGLLQPDKDYRITSNLDAIVILSVIFSVIAVFTVLANVIIIIAIVRVSRKHYGSVGSLRVRKAISKTLMSSMAVSDTCVGCFIMSMSVYEQVSGGKWSLGFTLCDLRHLCDVYFCTVSVYHVVCMAIDRYMAVCQPMFYRTLTCRTGYLLVFVSWTVPAVLTFLPILNGWHVVGIEEVAICLRLDDVCANIFSKTFQIIAVVVSFYIPILLIFFFYLLILKEIRNFKKRFALRRSRNQSRLGSNHRKLSITMNNNVNLANGTYNPAFFLEPSTTDSLSPSHVISNRMNLSSYDNLDEIEDEMDSSFCQSTEGVDSAKEFDIFHIPFPAKETSERNTQNNILSNSECNSPSSKTYTAASVMMSFPRTRGESCELTVLMVEDSAKEDNKSLTSGTSTELSIFGVLPSCSTTATHEFASKASKRIPSTADSNGLTVQLSRYGSLPRYDTVAREFAAIASKRRAKLCLTPSEVKGTRSGNCLTGSHKRLSSKAAISSHAAPNTKLAASEETTTRATSTLATTASSYSSSPHSLKCISVPGKKTRMRISSELQTSQIQEEDSTAILGGSELKNVGVVHETVLRDRQTFEVAALNGSILNLQEQSVKHTLSDVGFNSHLLRDSIPSEVTASQLSFSDSVTRNVTHPNIHAQPRTTTSFLCMGDSVSKMNSCHFSSQEGTPDHLPHRSPQSKATSESTSNSLAHGFPQSHATPEGTPDSLAHPSPQSNVTSESTSHSLVHTSLQSTMTWGSATDSLADRSPQSNVTPESASDSLAHGSPQSNVTPETNSHPKRMLSSTNSSSHRSSAAQEFSSRPTYSSPTPMLSLTKSSIASSELRPSSTEPLRAAKARFRNCVSQLMTQLSTPQQSGGGLSRCQRRLKYRTSKHKAVKTIGSIVVCFTLCWLPFSIYVIVDTYHGYSLPPWAFLTVLWLGYVNSAVNPVLYCCNASINSAVKQLICPPSGKRRS